MIRRPGRPPLDTQDPSVKLTVSVTTKKYDELYARAKAARMNLSEFVRRELRASPACNSIRK